MARSTNSMWGVSIERFVLLSFVGIVFLVGSLILLGHDWENSENIDEGSSILRQVERPLKEADVLMKKFLEAEELGNEADRKKYIVLAHGKFSEVMSKIDSLRRPPYADKNEQWLPGYEQFEKYEGEAGAALHDISRRAHTEEYEDTPEDEALRELYSHFKAAKSSFALFEAADLYHHQEDRRRFIRLSKNQFQAALNQLDLLRKRPFVNSEGRWTPTYQHLEKTEKEANEKLVSIAKRAYVGDFD